MQVFDLVKSKYKFPPNITERGYQIDAVNTLGTLPAAGYYAEVGTGKTLMATISALYKKEMEGRRTIVVAPPILVKSWYKWLAKIDGVTVTDYRGTPKQRALKNLQADFVVMSIQVFKNDYERIVAGSPPETTTLVLDEATAIKNIESQNYAMVKLYRDLGGHFMALTGTPLNTPNDAYAYIKLVAPLVYRSHRAFELTHVEKTDFFGKASQWKNLDLLKDNMKINSVRLLKKDVLTLPEAIFDPIFYDLSDRHYQLYKQLVEDQLIELPDGNIDDISASKIYTCMQQIIWNPAYFAQDPSFRPAGFELLDNLVEELELRSASGRKLLVFANFRLTINTIAQYLSFLKPGIINGAVTPSFKQESFERFVDDPLRKLLIIQPSSGGKGLDGMQEVCSDAIFVESPASPIDFEQCTGRIDRSGQTTAPHFRLAVASRTIEVKRHHDLLYKDETAGYVQGTKQTLREALYGEGYDA
jgi:SNF2 family DNA or RNA helicase